MTPLRKRDSKREAPHISRTSSCLVESAQAFVASRSRLAGAAAACRIFFVPAARRREARQGSAHSKAKKKRSGGGRALFFFLDEIYLFFPFSPPPLKTYETGEPPTEPPTP